MIAMHATVIAVTRRPSVRARMPIEPMFVAGPTSRNTNAAPGESPFIMSAAAIGVDAEAHT